MDFVLAYPQVDIKVQLYMEMPHGFKCKDNKPCEVVLALCKNLYGQKQASHVWCQHQTRFLTTKDGFTQSMADECVFYQNGIMLLIFVDDTTCIYHDEGAAQKLAKELKQSFDITINGTITDFLGVRFKRRLDGAFVLSQPQLIDSILCDLKLIISKKKKAKPQ